MLECSWRAGTVRVPAPPEGAGISPARRTATSWGRGRRAHTPHCHLLGTRASRPHTALPPPGGAGVAPARRAVTSWGRGRLACTPHGHLLGTRASCPHAARPSPGSVGISPACRTAISWERGHLARMPPCHFLGAWASRPHAALPPPGDAGVAPARRTATSWGRGHLACTPHWHLLGARASRLCTVATHYRSEGILISTVPRKRDALALWQPAQMVNEHSCSSGRVALIAFLTKVEPVGRDEVERSWELRAPRGDRNTFRSTLRRKRASRTTR